MSEEQSKYLAVSDERPSVVAMPRPSTAVIPSGADIDSMMTLGEQFLRSGLMPSTVKNAAAVVVIIQKGRELNIPPMQAINGINVIQGKPTCSADLMSALIYRDHGDNALRWLESTDERVVLQYKRKGWPEPSTYTWSKEDSRKAGLSGGNHAKYPQAMMRARAISAVARMAFNDSIGGMYETSEMEEVVAAQPVPSSTAPLRERMAVIAEQMPDQPVDERQAALERFESAVAAVGLDDETLTFFVADLIKREPSEVTSHTTWSPAYLAKMTKAVAERGPEWLARREADEATFREMPEGDDAQSIEFPRTPQTSLLTDDTQPASGADRWTS